MAGIGTWIGGYLGAVHLGGGAHDRLHIVLTRTRWGLHTIAAGGNLLGAREAGIHVNRIKYGNFMISGLLGALVGLQTHVLHELHRPHRGRLPRRCSTP